MKKYKKTRKILYLIIVLLIIAIGIVLAVLLMDGRFNYQTPTITDNDRNEQENTLIGEEEQQLTAEGMFVVESLYYDLYYPVAWEDLIIAIEELNVVHFSANYGEKVVNLFDVVAVESTDNENAEVEAFIVLHELEDSIQLSEEEKNEVLSMQQDVKYIVEYLKKQNIKVAE